MVQFRQFPDYGLEISVAAKICNMRSQDARLKPAAPPTDMHGHCIKRINAYTDSDWRQVQVEDEKLT
jgi:hypothetical protein